MPEQRFRKHIRIIDIFLILMAVSGMVLILLFMPHKITVEPETDSINASNAFPADTYTAETTLFDAFSKKAVLSYETIPGYTFKGFRRLSGAVFLSDNTVGCIFTKSRFKALYEPSEDALSVSQTPRYIWESVSGDQNTIDDGYLVRWRPHYYASHYYTDTGRALFSLHSKDIIRLDGRNVWMKGSIIVDSSETVEEILNKTNHPDVCFQTCCHALKGVYLVWYGNYENGNSG